MPCAARPPPAEKRNCAYMMLPLRPWRAAMLVAVAVFYFVSVHAAVPAARYNPHTSYDKDPWGSKQPEYYAEHPEYSKYSDGEKKYEEDYNQKYSERKPYGDSHEYNQGVKEYEGKGYAPYKSHDDEQHYDDSKSYGDDANDYKYEDPKGYKGYEQPEEYSSEHDKDSYYAPHEDKYEDSGDEYSYGYKDDGYYGQYDDMQMVVDGCMQWTGPDPSQLPNATSQYRSQFRCCKKQDDPHICLDRYANEEYESYGYSHDKDDTILDTISQLPAAVCSWSYDGPGCPAHIMKTCLGHGWLNCTTTSVAPKCDIPKYISFIAKGYFVAEDARSCQAWFDATGSADETQRRFASNVTGNTFASTAWTFEGKIVWVDGMYGDQDAKGSVKFVTQFGERTVDPEEKKAATAKPAPAAKKVATAQAAPAEVSVASFQPIDTHHSEHGYEYGSESYELPKVYKRRANHTSDAYYEEEEHLEFVKGGSLHFTIWTKKY